MRRIEEKRQKIIEREIHKGISIFVCDLSSISVNMEKELLFTGMRIRKSWGISIIEFLTHKKGRRRQRRRRRRRKIHYAFTYSHDILKHWIAATRQFWYTQVKTNQAMSCATNTLYAILYHAIPYHTIPLCDMPNHTDNFTQTTRKMGMLFLLHPIFSWAFSTSHSTTIYEGRKVLR